MSTDPSTEEKIFVAARDVFHEQGYGGARMQEIAKRAGINQSMLHYYYRSKEKLFDAVFRLAAGHLMQRMFSVLDAELPLLDKIERFVHTHIDLISENPHMPAFVLQELRRNPDRLSAIVGSGARDHLAILARQVSEAVEAGEIAPITPGHLIANMMGMTVFPFISRPILETALAPDVDDYDAFLQERKVQVTRFIINGLKP